MIDYAQCYCADRYFFTHRVMACTCRFSICEYFECLFYADCVDLLDFIIDRASKKLHLERDKIID